MVVNFKNALFCDMRQSPLAGGVGGGAASIFLNCSVTMMNCCEISSSKRGQKPLNTEAEGFTLLKTVTRRQPVKTEQTEEVYTCCSDLLGVQTREAAIISCSYEFQEFNESRYQRKPLL